MSSRRRATLALLLLRSAIRTSMHEDAGASVPDFYSGMVFCREKTFFYPVTSVTRVTWIGQKREKLRL